GDTSNGAVKEIVAAGGYTTVNTLGSGFKDPMGVAVDASGNVFVADEGNSAVKKIMTASGNFGSVNVGASSAAPLTLYFTFDTGGTLGSTTVLTQGAVGLDFTDAGGGSCTANTAYNAGDTCTVNVTFKPRFPGTRYGAAELLVTSGNLLANGYLQGTGVGPQAIFARIRSGVYLPANESILGSGFNAPQGVAVDGSGNVFVADTNNSAVKEILAEGGYTTVKTLGSGFSYPVGVALDGGGNIFVADDLNNAVKELVAAGGYVKVKTLVGGFYSPRGVAVDGRGNVYVDDAGNFAVKEIPAGCASSSCVTTLGGGFIQPNGRMSVDGSGNVFVTDPALRLVKEIPASCIAGANNASCVLTLGGRFYYPADAAVDGNGNVFVADHTVVKEIPASCIAGANDASCVLTVGSGFVGAEAVAVDGSGNVYVADWWNDAVTKRNYADPPSLTFAKTTVGVKSSDSPQTVTVSNNG